MSNIYAFEKINYNDLVKYYGAYGIGGFSFIIYPYFTTIVTTYDDGSYGDAYINNGNLVTKSDIEAMIGEGVKVDLVVMGLDTADLILPMTAIDDDYAYFSNGELSLIVDGNGTVSDSTNIGK